MIGIKKLDLYILKKFLLLFVAAFFICLFVFMMQFTWRYVEELVGKGLTVDILAQFFWYMGISLVPTSLPLSVLLASLITFGNMGEQLELLSMKAAGVSLMRIMRPILLMVLLLMGISFVFQNKISPEATIKMRTLLFSMKQQSPAVEIPEGVFYSGVPDVNLYVQKKNAETGMLYNLIIYKTDKGFDRAQIVLADSGRMEVTADKMHLKLDLWNGEQFENLQSQTASMQRSKSVPYDRETFVYKTLLINFDSNFNLADAQAIQNMPETKDLLQIEHSADSINAKMDSVGRSYYHEAKERWIHVPRLLRNDSALLAAELQKESSRFDSIVANYRPDLMQAALRSAKNSTSNFLNELEWKSSVTRNGDYTIRRHWVFWHQKFTYSLACLFFFFIGAPLGAIIRKGGLGLPTVVSVLIFIFYYIIDASGMKMARDGSWNMLYGMWVSSLVLCPFGIFLTYKANKDSMVFNVELYSNFFRRIFGLRSRRHLFRKEVIINDPDYVALEEKVAELMRKSKAYSENNRLLVAPNYFKVFFHYADDHEIIDLNEQMEEIIEELSNSRSSKVLQAINHLPIIFTRAHVSPLHGRRRNIVAGVVFPIGILLWLRIWRFRLRLRMDLSTIEKTCAFLQKEIHKINQENQLKNN